MILEGSTIKESLIQPPNDSKNSTFCSSGLERSKGIVVRKGYSATPLPVILYSVYLYSMFVWVLLSSFQSPQSMQTWISIYSKASIVGASEDIYEFYIISEFCMFFKHMFIMFSIWIQPWNIIKSMQIVHAIHSFINNFNRLQVLEVHGTWPQPRVPVKEPWWLLLVAIKELTPLKRKKRLPIAGDFLIFH